MEEVPAIPHFTVGGRCLLVHENMSFSKVKLLMAYRASWWTIKWSPELEKATGSNLRNGSFCVYLNSTAWPSLPALDERLSFLSPFPYYLCSSWPLTFYPHHCVVAACPVVAKANTASSFFIIDLILWESLEIIWRKTLRRREGKGLFYAHKLCQCQSQDLMIIIIIITDIYVAFEVLWSTFHILFDLNPCPFPTMPAFFLLHDILTLRRSCLCVETCKNLWKHKNFCET